MFSSGFLQLIVLAGLVWTGAGVVTLILLLAKDWKNNELW